jgi:hypothetical protein
MRAATPERLLRCDPKSDGALSDPGGAGRKTGASAWFTMDL